MPSTYESHPLEGLGGEGVDSLGIIGVAFAVYRDTVFWRDSVPISGVLFVTSKCMFVKRK